MLREMNRWSLIMHWILAITNACNGLTYVTRFSCDIFGMIATLRLVWIASNANRMKDSTSLLFTSKRAFKCLLDSGAWMVRRRLIFQSWSLCSSS